MTAAAMPATSRWTARHRAPRHRRPSGRSSPSGATSARTAWHGPCRCPPRAAGLAAGRPPARRPSARRRSAAATARSSRRIWRSPAASALAWSSTPSETGRKSSMTGLALWRIAARMAATVFCSGTKPADAPPTGDRYLGRPLRAGAGELDEAGGAGRGRLRDRQAERLEGERQAGGVEIAGRQDQRCRRPAPAGCRRRR